MSGFSTVTENLKPKFKTGDYFKKMDGPNFQVNNNTQELQEASFTKLPISFGQQNFQPIPTKTKILAAVRRPNFD